MPYKKLAVILGNCLFSDHERLNPDDSTMFFMAEDAGLCTHFKYHKHKLILFLSAMRSHADDVEGKYPLAYHHLSSSNRNLSYEEKLKETLSKHDSITELITYDIEDHFFEQRIRDFCKEQKLKLTVVDSPGFITTKAKFKAYNEGSKRPFMHTFYQQQRKELGILLESDNKSPLHGSWSFDEENRKKLPKDIKVPDTPTSHPTEHTEDVIKLVDELFADHPGDSANFHWATTRRQVLHLLNDFLKERFENFGPYEDAIDHKEVFLFHSVLSPYINMGLITPDEVVDKALEYYEAHDTHYPSVEGFVRQIIGWREFMRGIYHEYDEQLNANHFNHKRKMKDCWYEGTTGILPLDASINKAMKFGYTHHIERLMVLGNIMLLCEIDPEEVYKWFMEMYVDSSDWVMAPNVYGMSQFADGGIFATKPYIGGANYIRKMSHFGKGDWEDIVNGLYWRFINENVETFAKNQRMSMMVATLRKMSPEKKEKLFKAADQFIEKVSTE
ncbi:cryptochrome/photolyase family protein [Ekhidna sp. To15]|uniref:cryptochrome/photolyase family protein n=1 Tax=Ekhidna sp. To15 TaxID=3395267 RepID=UPI003F51E75B